MDSRFELPKDIPERDEKDEQTVIEAIDCLLKLKGSTTLTQLSAIFDFSLMDRKMSEIKG